MLKRDIENKIYEVAEPIVVNLGYKLIDTELAKDSGQLFLRIVIDNDNGINLEDCSVVSKAVKKVLDEKFKDDFYDYFEVSSPGMDRPLKTERDFKLFKGKKIKITFYKGHNDCKFMDGILEGTEENNLLVNVDNETVKIDKNIIKSVRLNEFKEV